ncbi:MAG: RHS repeat domain-containing protein [Pseudomonadota bacterium]
MYEHQQYFCHPDHVGSPGFVTDANGQVYEHLEYFAFGETWVQERSNIERRPYLFTGKELGEETQLYYFGARYYDPRTSLWQSPDPILEKYLPTSDDPIELSRLLMVSSFLCGKSGPARRRINRRAGTALFPPWHKFLPPAAVAPIRAGRHSRCIPGTLRCRNKS